MSRKTGLTSQTRKVFIVIRKNIAINIDLIKSFCREYFDRYAFIEHKNHIKHDTGELEGIHYHIVGDYRTNKTPLSTRLNQIVKWFRFDNANGIEIEKYDTFEGCLQYLTHKNNPEKTQVDKSLIVHNLTQSDFDILYNAEIGNVITFDLLYSSCLYNKNIVGVIKDIGVGNYRIYRNVIWDIWNTLNNKEGFERK